MFEKFMEKFSKREEPDEMEFKTFDDLDMKDEPIIDEYEEVSARPQHEQASAQENVERIQHLIEEQAEMQQMQAQMQAQAAALEQESAAGAQLRDQVAAQAKELAQHEEYAKYVEEEINKMIVITRK